MRTSFFARASPRNDAQPAGARAASRSDAQAGVFALGAAAAGDRRARPGRRGRARTSRRSGARSRRRRGRRARRGSRAPPSRFPPRFPAEPTTSLTTRQAKTAPAKQAIAPTGALTLAVPESRKPTTRPITAGEQGHPTASRAVGAGGAGEHPDRDADAELEADAGEGTHAGKPNSPGAFVPIRHTIRMADRRRRTGAAPTPARATWSATPASSPSAPG